MALRFEGFWNCGFEDYGFRTSGSGVLVGRAFVTSVFLFKGPFYHSLTEAPNLNTSSKEPNTPAVRNAFSTIASFVSQLKTVLNPKPKFDIDSLLKGHEGG